MRFPRPRHATHLTRWVRGFGGRSSAAEAPDAPACRIRRRRPGGTARLLAGHARTQMISVSYTEIHATVARATAVSPPQRKARARHQDAAADPARRHRRVPHHGRHAARRRRRRRGGAARPPPRWDVRGRRHDRPCRRQRATARRRARRGARGHLPRRRGSGHHRPRRPPPGRGDAVARRDAGRRPHARARARVPRRRRGDPRAARRRRPHRRVPALDRRARRARRHHRLLARPDASSRRSSCSRRSTSPSASSSRSSSSASGSPSCRCASGSATTSRRAPQKQQREYLLRQQMESIRKELGEDDGSVADEYRTKIAEAGMPERRRASRPSASSAGSSAWASSSAESPMIRTYLDWLIAVPWGERSEERLDPVARARGARRRPRRPRRRQGAHRRVPGRAQAARRARPRGRDRRGSGAILTLVGPPGVGKTSLGESIARALGREFVRMSLGGVRDEAEIRGHRRTYVGALPGRLVRALRDAGTMNPVILLDEVDKVGADWRGDPSSALLEVLDPAQNHTFRDHYLDVDLDLSEVLFIATANVADTIPGPLLDRMEVIRLDGYTDDEKVAIARDYLWPRQLERNGLRDGRGRRSTDDAAAHGRRRVHPRGRRPQARARARQAAAQDRDADRVGEAARRRSTIDADDVRDALGRQTVLPGGGGAHGRARRRHRPRRDRHRRRRAVHRGDRDAGRRRGALDAHRPARRRHEGVGADRALLRARARRRSSASTPSAFEDREFHVHVPAGAIPKDGPSAGVTMTTALASLLTGRPVTHTVGMTGEVTLQGRVLPIGGLKQKVLAAHAAGPDRRDPAGAQRAATSTTCPRTSARQMTFHPVMSDRRGARAGARAGGGAAGSHGTRRALTGAPVRDRGPALVPSNTNPSGASGIVAQQDLTYRRSTRFDQGESRWEADPSYTRARSAAARRAGGVCAGAAGLSGRDLRC